MHKKQNGKPDFQQAGTFSAESLTNWLDQMLRDPMISPATFRVAFALSKHCVNGEIRASLTEIALLCGVCPPTAGRALERLMYRKRINYRQNTRFALVTIRL